MSVPHEGAEARPDASTPATFDPAEAFDAGKPTPQASPSGELDALAPTGKYRRERIEGTDMSPALMPGDILLIDETRTAPAAGIFLLEIGGRQVVRRLSARLDGALTVTADALPGESMPLGDAVRILGRAVFLLRCSAL